MMMMMTTLQPLPARKLGLFAIGAAAALTIAGPAHAGCKKAAPTRVCQVLDSAPRANPSDAAVVQTIRVFDRLDKPFAALSGRDTGLVVLAESARIGSGPNAKPIPPAAYICPGAPPVVYVPWTLVSLVFEKKKYPEDFMAFVIGHELGHRANDFDLEGCQLAAFQRPGKGVHEEELADKRSAFFTAVAGYSTRAVANQELVGKFLEQEYNIRKFTVEKRKQALLTALKHMDALENLYQVSLAVAFSGDTAAANRLLSWADELVRGRGVPLPELVMVRALALMMHAAPSAPWLAKAKLPVDASHLRCAPIFPSHSALAPKAEAGAEVRAAADVRKAALKALKRAEKLIDEAADLGAPPLTVASARSCLAFYMGDPTTANEHHSNALKLAKKAPKPVIAALKSNGALHGFLADVMKRKAPGGGKSKELARWGKALAKKRKAWGVNPTLAAFVAGLGKLPTVQPPTAPVAPKCRKKPKLVAFQGPAAKGVKGLGQCPAGWTLAQGVVLPLFTPPPGPAQDDARSWRT